MKSFSSSPFLSPYFRIFLFSYFCILVFLYFCIFVFLYFCILVFSCFISIHLSQNLSWLFEDHRSLLISSVLFIQLQKVLYGWISIRYKKKQVSQSFLLFLLLLCLLFSLVFVFQHKCLFPIHEGQELLLCAF